MTRTHLLIVFSALLLAVSFNKTNAQNLGVQPTTLDFALSSSQSETQVIHLSNASGKKAQFKLYINDWMRDSTGGHTYYEANSLPRSCARWITLSKNFIEIEPGQSTSVNVKLQLPDSPSASTEMKWAMLFVETVEEQDNSTTKGTAATVKNLLRVGVHIYQTPPTLTKKQIAVYAIKKVPTATNTYQVYCQNTGDLMLECKSYLKLTSVTDGKEYKLDDVEFPMFPGQYRYVTFQLPANLPKGKYSALGFLDAGEEIPLEAKESTIEIK